MKKYIALLFLILSILLLGSQIIDPFSSAKMQIDTASSANLMPLYQKGLLLDAPLVEPYINGSYTLDRTPYNNRGFVDGATSTSIGYSFDGIDDLIDFGNVGLVKSISFWVNPASSTLPLFEETDDVGVSISSWNISYPSWDNCYVNNIETNKITTGWNNIVLTSETYVDVSELRFGLLNTDYFEGYIIGIRIYRDVIPASYIVGLFNLERYHYSIPEIPLGYSLVFSFIDNASDTSNLRLQDKDGNSCLVDWGDGVLQEINTIAETTSHIIPSNIKIYSRNGLRYFRSTNNNFHFDIGDLPDGLIIYMNMDSNTCFGNIANLPSSVNYFYNVGLNKVNDYTSGRVWASMMNRVYHRPASGYGLSSTEVDNLLIDLANVIIWIEYKSIDIAGNNDPRTSASDAAVAILEGKGVTVITN